MDNELLVVIAVAAIMLFGLFGTVLPFVPGLPLIAAGAALYGFARDWDEGAPLWFAAIAALMVVGIVAKLVLPARHVAQTGVPRSTLMLGAVAGTVGFFVIPVIGLPLGAVAGVFLAEQRRTGNSDRAWAATKTAIVGFGMGALIEFAAGIAMIVVWAAWAIVT